MLSLTKFVCSLLQGSTYGSDCPFPVEATKLGVCPTLFKDAGLAGSNSFDLSDEYDQPPTVKVLASLYEFDNIDQAALTFTVSSHCSKHYKLASRINYTQFHIVILICCSL